MVGDYDDTPGLGEDDVGALARALRPSLAPQAVHHLACRHFFIVADKGSEQACVPRRSERSAIGWELQLNSLHFGADAQI